MSFDLKLKLLECLEEIQKMKKEIAEIQKNIAIENRFKRIENLIEEGNKIKTQIEKDIESIRKLKENNYE